MSEKDLKKYTAEEVAEHVTPDSLWIVIKHKVYNVTPYIDKHPGGPDKFLDNAGQDVTKEFEENHRSKIPQFIAQNYEIGTVVKSYKKALKEKEPTDRRDSKVNKHEDKKDEVYSTEYVFPPARCALIRKQFVQLAEIAGSVVEAGNLIYDALFKALGVKAKKLFKTPKKVLAFRVISQVERFVSHVEEKDFLENELYNMAMRHLAYVQFDVMKKTMSLFVSTIVGVIRSALDEYWDDTAEESWTCFFNYIGGHLLKNSNEFGGKVNLLRSSWKTVEDLRKVDKKKSGGDDRSGGFGDALFFNIGVMSPEISTLIIRDRSVLALLFEKGFKMMVDFVSDPPVLNEELYILAARHLDYGAQEHHFPVFGQAIMVTLRSLLPRCWNWAHEDAWGWLWNMASKFMIRTIANGHSHKQRIDDSITRLEGVDMDELGAQFYSILFESSVEVQQYFYKPNSLIKFIISKVLKIISTLLHAPDVTTHDIRALGMRHIKYAIPPDLFPLFGAAITATLPNFLEGFWDEDIREAWATVFEFIKDCMTRAVVSGTNLITKALVSNNVTDCDDALSAAPRCERILWLLELDVSNIKVSPFFWALSDGKYDIAHYMLDDILKIRADREAYYYGKDILFRVHPDLIGMLCRVAPQMLTNVFDGLMWYSRNIVDGRRRVNYYVRHVYGDPHEESCRDSFATPLADLTRLHRSDVFTHPFVLFLLDLKWMQFGRNLYFGMQVLNVVSLILFVIGYLILDDDDVSFVFRCLSVACFTFSLAHFQLRRIFTEVKNKQLVHICCGLSLPVFFMKVTNTGRLLANLFAVAAFITDKKFFDQTSVVKVSSWFQSLAICLLFPLLVETGQLNVRFIKFQHKVGMVSKQFAIYLLSVVFMLVGFATSLLLSQGKDGSKSDKFDSFWNSFISLFASLVGIYEFNLQDFSGQMLFFWIVFCLASVFLMTRVLSSIMSTIAIEEESLVDGYAFLERAKLVIELESSCSLVSRQRFWDKMQMDAPVEFDAGDLGPSGGLQVQEHVGRDASERAADDRITRYPGQCDPGKEWPRIVNTTEKTSDQRLEKIAFVAEKIRKSIAELHKKGFSGKGALPTLSESAAESFQSE